MARSGLDGDWDLHFDFVLLRFRNRLLPLKASIGVALRIRDIPLLVVFPLAIAVVKPLCDA
jgi:hypothetical protein